MAASHPYTPLLRRFGFLATRRSSTFQFAPNRMPEAELAFLADRHAHVHLMAGDFNIA